MKEHFQNVKEVYDEFYKYLFVKHGMYPVKDTNIGYWGVSVSTELFDFFNTINLSNYNHLLDLGSGDGKVVMIASLFTNATGIEHDPWLHDVAHDVKNKLYHVPHVQKVNLINDNFMNHSLDEYDIAFLNPDKTPRRLHNKLVKEFNGKLILYGPHNHPEEFEPEEEHDINGTKISIYNYKK